MQSRITITFIKDEARVLFVAKALCIFSSKTISLRQVILSRPTYLPSECQKCGFLAPKCRYLKTNLMVKSQMAILLIKSIHSPGGTLTWGRASAPRCPSLASRRNSSSFLMALGRWAAMTWETGNTFKTKRTHRYNPFNSRQTVQKLATTGNFCLEKVIKGPEYSIYWIMWWTFYHGKKSAKMMFWIHQGLA